MRILVVEDDRQTAVSIRQGLREEGFSVDLVADGEEAVAAAMTTPFDVIVLDVMLPRRSGFEVIRSLRAAKLTVPTIMVTARDAMSDIVRGLDSGADDYLTKPFALDVLLARVRALSRRSPNAYMADLQFEDLTLNSRTHELARAGRLAALTRTEYALLEILMRRAGSIVPREALTEAGWGGGAEVSDSTLYVFMCALRAKIAQGEERQLLHTARGVGYTLRTEAC